MSHLIPMKIKTLLKKIPLFSDFFLKGTQIICAILLSFLFISCSENKESNQEAALISNQDYKNVFKPLDGNWKGKFYVYSDKRGQTKEPAQPDQIDEKYLEKLPLKEELVIDVAQTYVSENPYFQKVMITDTYPSANGEMNSVKSEGFNKVENGKLVCVVNKPDEKVVHQGRLDQEHTIIWSRNISNPLKIEYFRETVRQDSYTIIGWGYYGDDNPKLSPKTWFRGDYKKVK
ncbi:hypothetical protein [Flexithrix dorotheae]|uniref:hypothetical protein n=1 Tax=Flexithrix dorotheae TaxID=70993 RepID=UPI0003687E85|nr:hypothetical protein [Flexithrix dorotheae]